MFGCVGGSACVFLVFCEILDLCALGFLGVCCVLLSVLVLGVLGLLLMVYAIG